QEGEPSVEEILESIKKVIARDNREVAQAERRRRESAGIASDPRPEPAVESEPGEVLELAETAELVEEQEPADGLTTERTAGAMRESLAALAMLAEPGAQPQIVR